MCSNLKNVKLVSFFKFFSLSTKRSTLRALWCLRLPGSLPLRLTVWTILQPILNQNAFKFEEFLKCYAVISNSASCSQLTMNYYSIMNTFLEARKTKCNNFYEKKNIQDHKNEIILKKPSKTLRSMEIFQCHEHFLQPFTSTQICPPTNFWFV